MRNMIAAFLLASLGACMTTPESAPDAVAQCEDTVMTFCEMQRACSTPSQVSDACSNMAHNNCAGNRTELTMTGYRACLDELQNHSTCDVSSGSFKISDNAATCLTTYEAWLNEQGAALQLDVCPAVCPTEHILDRDTNMVCASGALCREEPSCASLQTKYRGTISCTSDNNCVFYPGKGKLPCLGQTP